MDSRSSGGIHALIATLMLVASSASAIAQISADRIEQEMVASWLVTVSGEERSRLFTVREVARRPDGTHLLDATYGWTVGYPTPVWAEFVQTSNQDTLNIRTPANSVIIAKQSEPGSFRGTITYSNRKTFEIVLTRASEETVQLRVDTEIKQGRAGPGFAQENRDWGIGPTTSIRTNQPHAPTPREIPGTRTITTLELYASLSQPNAPILVDVLDGKHVTIRGAYWLPGAGGAAGRAEILKFEAALDKLTKGDKAKQLAFFCSNSECWLSYNAALRALESGYRNVVWYRGGTAAWRAAQFITESTAETAW